jgi:hypothetical protein
MPRGMGPGMGWRFGKRNGMYYTDKEIDRTTVEKDTRTLLGEVAKGETWTDPHGGKHIPLQVSGGVVGNLWEDVEPKTLDTGAYWTSGMGTKVELLDHGKEVGTLWLAE